MRRILQRSHVRLAFLWLFLLTTAVLTPAGALLLGQGLPAGGWFGFYTHSLLLVLPLKAVSYRLFELDRGLWRYAGLEDLLATGQAVLFSSGLIGLCVLLMGQPVGLLRLVAIELLLSLSVLLGARASLRVRRELFRSRRADRRLVVVGAGDAGEAVVRELGRLARPEFRPVAFVDDDPAKRGRKVHGVPVMGRLEELDAVARECDADGILVAICSVEPSRLRAILRRARETGLPVKRTPGLEEMLAGRAAIHELRDVTTEELLRRAPVRTERVAVDRLLSGRTVLVTGGAGSIGSELCRQILRHGPETLLVLDRDENALFHVEHELGAIAGRTRLVPLLANIQDETKLAALMGEHRPQLVFHAAAYKHVPVLEHFPEEAVRNNVHGTRVLARLAERHGAERFVLISTDKAVRPTSVMGTTKRVAELIVGDMDRRSRTAFTTIRFGNVLGSNGSVLQLFRRQIARGGPVTVTHPEIRRYFMTIPEAVELVLFAAAMDDPGSTYILDMGQQVRILDLAHHFIRLCGLEPGRDVPVEITGLRPGEKLYEELWTSRELPSPTSHPSILRAGRPAAAAGDLDAQLEALLAAAESGDRQAVVERLRALVPAYSGEPPGPAAARPGGVERRAAEEAGV